MSELVHTLQVADVLASRTYREGEYVVRQVGGRVGRITVYSLPAGPAPSPRRRHHDAGMEQVATHQPKVNSLKEEDPAVLVKHHSPSAALCVLQGDDGNEFYIVESGELVCMRA